jgi:hypothetical protein
MKNLSLFALLALVAVGCSDDSEDNKPASASIVGSWRPVKVALSSTPTAGGATTTVVTDASYYAGQSMTFNSDGTGVKLPGAVGQPQTYTYTAPLLKYQGTSQGRTVSFTKTVTKLTADSLVWEDEATTANGSRNTGTWRFAR